MINNYSIPTPYTPIFNQAIITLKHRLRLLKIYTLAKVSLIAIALLFQFTLTDCHIKNPTIWAFIFIILQTSNYKLFQL
jgi:hypothetical protein